MQIKRSAAQGLASDPESGSSRRSIKRGRSKGPRVDEIGGDFEPTAARGIRRRFASALFVSPGVLIFCPRLSNIRPYPALLAKSISPKLPSPSQFPVMNTNLDKTHSLPLPKVISNALPYSYAPPTILSRSHNPRYFLAFFPRLAEETRRRLSRQAAASAQITTIATNRAVQDIVNGADPGLATSAIPSPFEFATHGYDTEIEEYEDFGGVLVLYTRPDPTPYRITYSHTFDIYNSWKTDYCAMDCEWLFPPRKWVLEDRSNNPQKGHVDDRKPFGNEGSANGNHDDGMNGILGKDQADASEREEHGLSSKWKPPVFKRTPVVGPLQPTYSGTNPHPTFIVLYADHRLNLYSAISPTFPSTTSIRSNNTASNPDSSPAYPKLDVISCPILTPSVVLYESRDNTPPANGNPTKPENGKPDSSAASSPEQPLLQQQQQQILQQQQQTDVGDFTQGDSSAANTLAPATVGQGTTRKKRVIRPGQAFIYMREEDETIWVGFRSYRPTRLYIPVDIAPSGPPDLPNSSVQNGGFAPVGEQASITPAGFNKSPASTGISTEVLNLLRSVPRERGPNETSIEALASIGVMRGGVMRGGASNGNVGQSAPRDASLDLETALQAVNGLKDGSLRIPEGEEEDWISITELRLDLISGIPSMSARPIPQINFPCPPDSINPGKTKFIDFAFLDKDMAKVDSRENISNGNQGGLYAREGRDLDLIMFFQQPDQNQSEASEHTRIEHYRLCRKELDVSDAFGLLSASDKSGKKPDMKDLSRLEWVSKVIEAKTLPMAAIRVAKGLGVTDSGCFILLLRDAFERRIKKLAFGQHGLELQDTEVYLRSDHELLNISVNCAAIATSSRNAQISILPTISKATHDADINMQIVKSFASAIINASAYDDLLRTHHSTLRKLDGSSLDDILARIWRILQRHDACMAFDSRLRDWLLPYLEFVSTVFRSTMDDRLLTVTLLLHLISTERLFSQSRVDYTEKLEDGRSQRTRSYEPESAWLLLSHMEWYFQLVRAVVLRSTLPSESQQTDYIPSQNTSLDFLLSHPFALKLLHAICLEVRGFALFVTKSIVPFSPYPGSSQAALLRDAVSTSQLQDVLRDRVEGLGIRVSKWERVLAQLSQLQDEHDNDDEAELIHARLLPARLSTIRETLQIIASNADIVASQLHSTESPYRMPDFFSGRDILNKDPFVDGEIPGRQYCQCCLCHGIGSFWNYPSVRGYSPESQAARWMSQWAARCICGGFWV